MECKGKGGLGVGKAGLCSQNVGRQAAYPFGYRLVLHGADRHDAEFKRLASHSGHEVQRHVRRIRYLLRHFLCFFEWVGLLG